MKRTLALVMVIFMLSVSMGVITMADGGKSLDEVIGEAPTTTQTTQDSQNTQNTQDTQNNTTNNTETNSVTEDTSVVDKAQGTYEREQSFINGLNQAGNLSNVDVEGVETVTSGAKLVAAWIVQVLSYVIIAFVAVRVLLDICYVAIPFTRTFLANGYSGQAQSSGVGNMAGNMGGMGMNPMGGMGGGMYGHGRYGMGGGYGMNGMGGAGMMGGNQMGGMAGQNAMMNRNSSMVGNIQFVSNAALNAVATESVVGPDGKTQSPFKIYAKDMMVTLIIVPILIVLAATGVVSKLGFAIANFLVDGISKISGMI